jgi:hypothetical protein
LLFKRAKTCDFWKFLPALLNNVFKENSVIWRYFIWLFGVFLFGHLAIFYLVIWLKLVWSFGISSTAFHPNYEMKANHNPNTTP